MHELSCAGPLFFLLSCANQGLMPPCYHSRIPFKFKFVSGFCMHEFVLSVNSHFGYISSECCCYPPLAFCFYSTFGVLEMRNLIVQK